MLRKACPLLSTLSAILSLLSRISFLLSPCYILLCAAASLLLLLCSSCILLSLSLLICSAPHLSNASSLFPFCLLSSDLDLYFCLMPSFLVFCTFQEIRSHGITKVHNNFKHKFESNIKQKVTTEIFTRVSLKSSYLTRHSCY